MRVLAIDPGSTHSAYVVVNEDLLPLWFNKIPNDELLNEPDGAGQPFLVSSNHVVIEQIGHYGTGMSAGKDVFDTCIWIGRFWQRRAGAANVRVELVKRATIKTHLCGSAKANDGNVVQALIDRFAPGVRNHGKGVKNDPGYFKGFYADIWQAYALAVYYMDLQQGRVAA